MKDSEIDDIGVELFIEALYRRHGYDFRNYARASLKRRVKDLAIGLGLGRVSDLIPPLLHSPEFIDKVIPNFRYR